MTHKVYFHEWVGDIARLGWRSYPVRGISGSQFSAFSELLSREKSGDGLRNHLLQGRGGAFKSCGQVSQAALGLSRIISLDRLVDLRQNNGGVPGIFPGREYGVAIPGAAR
jgi:hypothetical protein